MCFRLSFALSRSRVTEVFHASIIAEDWPKPDLAPRRSLVMITRDAHTGRRRADLARWGLIPRSARDIGTAARPIKVPAEIIARAGAYRGACLTRRCLVPVSAFHESLVSRDGKQSFAVSRADGAPTVLAGLWEAWRRPTGALVRSVAIVVTDVNGDMAGLSDRMPVVLEPEDWPLWLGESTGDCRALLRPAAPRTLTLAPAPPAPAAPTRRRERATRPGPAPAAPARVPSPRRAASAAPAP